MSATFDDILQAVGRTPLVRLRKVAAGLPCTVYGKLEMCNPAGSVKDRVAKAMIEHAERQGQIQPGITTIIEATAGNTGLGLAIAAAVKGYRCILVVPDKTSREKIDLMRALGAEVVIVPANVPSESPEGYVGTARRLLKEVPNAWRPDQFTNPANPEIHYQTTGPEIFDQTNGRITCFVAGVGSGGTLCGVGRYLKERNPAIRIVGVDAEGSALSGSSGGQWEVEGIGLDYVPATLDRRLVDEWIRVSDRESFATARKLARLEGLLVGGSSGAAVAAALRCARHSGPGDVVVALLPDTGRNYLSKFYNDDWLRQHNFAD
jgi:cystathionine beta-synthase